MMVGVAAPDRRTFAGRGAYPAQAPLLHGVKLEDVQCVADGGSAHVGGGGAQEGAEVLDMGDRPVMGKQGTLDEAQGLHVGLDMAAGT